MKKSIKLLGVFTILTTLLLLLNVYKSNAQSTNKSQEPIPCCCNIGGYCESNGGGEICGFSYGAGYWCGVASGGCK